MPRPAPTPVCLTHFADIKTDVEIILKRLELLWEGEPAFLWWSSVFRLLDFRRILAFDLGGLSGRKFTMSHAPDVWRWWRGGYEWWKWWGAWSGLWYWFLISDNYRGRFTVCQGAWFVVMSLMMIRRVIVMILISALDVWELLRGEIRLGRGCDLWWWWWEWWRYFC